MSRNPFKKDIHPDFFNYEVAECYRTQSTAIVDISAKLRMAGDNVDNDFSSDIQEAKELELKLADYIVRALSIDLERNASNLMSCVQGRIDIRRVAYVEWYIKKIGKISHLCSLIKKRKVSASLREYYLGLAKYLYGPLKSFVNKAYGVI